MEQELLVDKKRRCLLPVLRERQQLIRWPTPWDSWDFGRKGETIFTESKWPPIASSRGIDWLCHPFTKHSVAHTHLSEY
jgi:hypothetical protein